MMCEIIICPTKALRMNTFLLLFDFISFCYFILWQVISMYSRMVLDLYLYFLSLRVSEFHVCGFGPIFFTSLWINNSRHFPVCGSMAPVPFFVHPCPSHHSSISLILPVFLRASLSRASQISRRNLFSASVLLGSVTKFRHLIGNVFSHHLFTGKLRPSFQAFFFCISVCISHELSKDSAFTMCIIIFSFQKDYNCLLTRIAKH